MDNKVVHLPCADTAPGKGKATSKLILETYGSLSEHNRSVEKVTAKIAKKGYQVDAARVEKVLKATVLEDLISEADVEAAGKVLQTLVNLNQMSNFKPKGRVSAYGVAEFVTSGLQEAKFAHAWRVKSCLTSIIRVALDAHEKQQKLVIG